MKVITKTMNGKDGTRTKIIHPPKGCNTFWVLAEPLDATDGFGVFLQDHDQADLGIFQGGLEYEKVLPGTMAPFIFTQAPEELFLTIRGDNCPVKITIYCCAESKPPFETLTMYRTLLPFNAYLRSIKTSLANIDSNTAAGG